MLRRRDLLLLTTAGLVGSAALAACSTADDPRPLEVSFDEAWVAFKRRYPELLAPTATAAPGDLAWGTAYALQALAVMVRATGSPVHAANFVRLSRTVLGLRDSELGRRDALGRSGQVWSVNARYTVLRAPLQDVSGASAFVVSCAPPGAAPSRRIEVLPVGPGRFELQLFDAANDEHIETITDLATGSTDPAYAPRKLQDLSPTKGWMTCQDVRAQRSAATEIPAQRVILQPQRVAFAVHTGMIAAPLVEFAQTVADNPELRAFRADAEVCRDAARAAWQFHRPDMATVAGHACIMIRRGTPARVDGTPVPHNQALALARLASGVAVTCRDTEAADAARALFATTVSDLRPVARGGVTWPYYFSQSACYAGFDSASNTSVFTPAQIPVPTAEDSSHGAIDVMALAVGHRNGHGVSDVTMKALNDTYQRLATSHSFGRTLNADRPAGGGNTSGPLWSTVAPAGDGLSSLDRAQVRAARSTNPTAVGLLGTALLASRYPKANA